MKKFTFKQHRIHDGIIPIERLRKEIGIVIELIETINIYIDIYEITIVECEGYDESHYLNLAFEIGRLIQAYEISTLIHSHKLI